MKAILVKPLNYIHPSKIEHFHQKYPVGSIFETDGSTIFYPSAKVLAGNCRLDPKYFRIIDESNSD